MQVLGPTLAVSDPIGEGTAPVESADGSMPAVEG
jgi:hypothetical protein